MMAVRIAIASLCTCEDVSTNPWRRSSSAIPKNECNWSSWYMGIKAGGPVKLMLTALTVSVRSGGARKTLCVERVGHGCEEGG